MLYQYFIGIKKEMFKSNLNQIMTKKGIEKGILFQLKQEFTH